VTDEDLLPKWNCKKEYILAAKTHLLKPGLSAYEMQNRHKKLAKADK